MDDDERRYGDADAQREDYEARRRRRSQRCQCGDDLPGRCPGPASCPYAAGDTDT